MTRELWRTLFRNLALVGFWLSVIPALLWVYIYVDLFVMQPSKYQTRLFGRQIAGLGSLRSIKNDCCLIPMGDGAIGYSYVIDPELARRLAADCRRTIVRGATINYYRVSGECVVRNIPFGIDGVEGGISATVKGNILGIEVDWL